MSNYQNLQFRMHPRVFSALGADLITNDIVAIIELVKNSYDAYAKNVWIRFGNDLKSGPYIEIEDDGSGMTRDIIENVWCVIATPYKEKNPSIVNDGKSRRVVGEKGLGRLSVARLGTKLQMITKACGNPCWEVSVDWTELITSNNSDFDVIKIRELKTGTHFKKSGTIVRIDGLNSVWDDIRLTDLEEDLTRLISPFEEINDFSIYLTKQDYSLDSPIKIEAVKFLSNPKYSIKGVVTEAGNIIAKYNFSDISSKKVKTKKLTYTWDRIYNDLKSSDNVIASDLSPDRAHCGEFTFEIRAWDIGADDTREIAEKYAYQKNLVRKAIRAHKGISLYRDSILVLPKSDNSRDWLGLDLRRVSRVGNRLSTSQIVGYVSISSDKNAKIQDTSDRERLVSNSEVNEFEALLIYIVSLLENERKIDKPGQEKERALVDLFQNFSTKDLLTNVIELSKEGGDISDVVPLLQDFSKSLSETQTRIQERFAYYNRLAAVGTIAQMLVHEIRNRTTIFGNFLDFVKNRFGPIKDKEFEREYQSVDKATDTLERLADTFSPLASRNFKRNKRSSIVEELIKECVDNCSGSIKTYGIECILPNTSTIATVDPGELSAILLNLTLNSIYWLGTVPRGNRLLEYKCKILSGRKRVQVWVNDSGPGIDGNDIELIFSPGVTRKPDGIGMGLTIASELVEGYQGKMLTKVPGDRGGASFAFDLPIKTTGDE